MDSPELRKLSRTQLQSLAKQEIIRAVGKTDDIIRRLMKKHRTGVPKTQNINDPSTSSGPLPPGVTRDSAAPEPTEDGEAAAEIFSSAIHSADSPQLLYPEDDELAAGPSTSNHNNIVVAPQPETTGVDSLAAPRPEEPITFSGALSYVPPLEPPCQYTQTSQEEAGARSDAPPPSEAPNLLGCQTDDVDGEAPNVHTSHANGPADQPQGGPTRHAVVDTLRQFTPLVNTQPKMRACLEESRCLLRLAEALVKKAKPDARELAVTREYLEVFTLGRMKLKPEIWDGTARMPKAERKLRMKWLRQRRREDATQKWKEVNEMIEKNKGSPMPLSAFTCEIESDEDVIESLETTPASSRAGSASSSKRSREGSVNGDYAVDANAGDEHPRKRARS